jgi:hypothetical protein
MPNYENFFAFDYWQYEVIRHLFSFTAAVFAASFVFFALNISQTAQRFRMASVISCVVMISATLELFLLWLMWNRAFEFDAATMTYMRAEGFIFANGYRYANWLIDVPMLMTQFIIVLGFAGAALFSRWWKLAVAGVSMVILGYIGQYWEPQAAGFVEGSAWGFWVFGLVAWLPLFYLFYALKDAISVARPRLNPEANRLISVIWGIFLVTWTLYGFVYFVPGIPVINESGTWVVVRQFGYTFADVTSKTVFGIVLYYAAKSMTEEKVPRAMTETTRDRRTDDPMPGRRSDPEIAHG